MKPIVVVAGIMDTKGKELLYIRDRVRVMGCDTLMIELSLGKEVKADWIDVHISDLQSIRIIRNYVIILRRFQPKRQR